MTLVGWLPLLLVRGVLAGTPDPPAPGVEAWSGPYGAYEAPGTCPTCDGVRAFAVVAGTGWFLLSRSVVSTTGYRVELPEPGVDLAAGPGGLWVLTTLGAAPLVDGALGTFARSGLGRPLEVGGDGTVRTALSLAGREPVPPGGTAWGGGRLEVEDEAEGGWVARWDGVTWVIPGAGVVDARAVGQLPDGRVVLAVTTSPDGSAADAVRFVAVGPMGLEERSRSLPNGDLALPALTRRYAVDPTDGTSWTLLVAEDRLSLRRLATPPR